MSKLRSGPKTIESSHLPKLRQPSSGEETTLLKIAEVADRLSLSHLTVRRLIREGKLPVVRVSSRAIRVREADLRQFIEERLSSVEEEE